MKEFLIWTAIILTLFAGLGAVVAILDALANFNNIQ